MAKLSTEQRKSMPAEKTKIDAAAKKAFPKGKSKPKADGKKVGARLATYRSGY